MIVTRNLKIVAEQQDIRDKFPLGVYSVLKGYRASEYVSLATWDEVEAAQVGAVIARPGYNSYGWHGPVGVRLTRDIKANYMPRASAAYYANLVEA